MHLKPKDQPRRRREPVHVYPDGREVIDTTTSDGKRIYKGLTLAMAERQGNRCALCAKVFFTEPTFDHQNGRHPSRIDERIEVNGEWLNAALCWVCNGFKGSRRIPYKITRQTATNL
jgi:hypothetical protein